MTSVFIVLALVVALLLWGRFPMEIVGLFAIVLLTQLNTITPAEATAGFGNSIVITMGGLFVLGGALIKTGVAQLAGDAMERGSRGEPRRLLILVILVSASLSTVLSSTGTVALLIPAVVTAAHAAGRSPSRYLIPLAYGSLIGGMLTLVGGTPNLIAQDALTELGRPGFGFFSFSWVGGPILLLAVVYLAFFGEHLIPRRVKPGLPGTPPTVDELIREYGVMADLHKLTLPSEERWKPLTLAELELRSQYHVDIVAIRATGTGVVSVPSADTVLHPGQILFAKASTNDLEKLREKFGVAHRPYKPDTSSSPILGRGLAELILVPRSRLNGKSLAESRFFRRFGVRVLQIRRGDQNLSGDIAEARLRFGDALLVEGPLPKLSELGRERFDFVVVGAPRSGESQQGLSHGGKTALTICVAMLAAISLNWLSPAMAAVLAGIAVVQTRCLTLEEAYSSVQWGSLFLVATMLPLGTALSNSGGLDFLSKILLNAVGDNGPFAALLGLYLISTALGQVMSNTATALLLTPLAIDMAKMLNVAPEPLLMGIAFGAAMAFLTPIASPVNTLVVAPGDYRFTDFVKVGLPLHLMASILCLWLIPLVFPFALDASWQWPK